MIDAECITETVRNRFWAKVRKDADGCWFWTGSHGHDEKGQCLYGRLLIGKSSVAAHRVSWFINRGLIPKGILVLHHCDQPLCVNPDHLFLGTHKDNMQDSLQKDGCALAKLRVDDVVTIRRLYTEGKLGCVRISQMFGVTPGHVCNIANRKSWKEIP